MVALILMIPWALYFRIESFSSNVQNFDVCFEKFPKRIYQKAYFLGVIFLTCYALPLMFIVVCYALIGYRVWHRDAPGITSSKGVIEKSKIRVVKMLVVVVLLFMFSWMPLYTTRLVDLFTDLTSEQQNNILKYVVPFAQWLGTSNSCMNPLVYCLFSQKIRRRIKAMVCCSKQELRTLYTKRSMMYSSVVQHNSGNGSRDNPNSIRDHAENGYGHHYGGGGLSHHRTKPTHTHNMELISLRSSGSCSKSSPV